MIFQTSPSGICDRFLEINYQISADFLVLIPSWPESRESQWAWPWAPTLRRFESLCWLTWWLSPREKNAPLIDPVLAAKKKKRDTNFGVLLKYRGIFLVFLFFSQKLRWKCCAFTVLTCCCPFFLERIFLQQQVCLGCWEPRCNSVKGSVK